MRYALIASGACFGIAASNGTGRVAVFRQIPLVWCLTLPIAGGLAFAAALLLR